jgi:hypothetical protein
MEKTIREVARKIPLDFEKVDVDESVELKAQYGAQVPVLSIDGRKAFKYRLTASALEKRLTRRRFWARLAGRATKGGGASK